MKKLLLILIILLLTGFFYYSYNSRTQKTNQNLSEPTASIVVFEMADKFYKNYDSCMQNPPSAAAGKVSEYCQNNSGLTTSGFAKNIENGGIAKAGADPVFCAQNPPESITVSPDAQVSGSKATVFVNEKMGPTGIKVQVDFLEESGEWKIDNIICPLP